MNNWANIEVGQRWQHKKRGTLYTVVALGVMQDSGLHSDAFDGEDVVIYRGSDGRHWVRRYCEFADGRFFLVDRLVQLGEQQ
jgi:hypothetical protein